MRRAWRNRSASRRNGNAPRNRARRLSGSRVCGWHRCRGGCAERVCSTVRSRCSIARATSRRRRPLHTAVTMLCKSQSSLARCIARRRLLRRQPDQDALKLRGQLDAHESVITRDGVWLGRNWLRVARDADETPGRAGAGKRNRRVAGATDTLRQRVGALEERSTGPRAIGRAGATARCHSTRTQYRAPPACRITSPARRAAHPSGTGEARESACARNCEEIGAQISHDQDEQRTAHERLQQALDLMEANTQERAPLNAQRDELRHAPR